jgi:hypothetical protein
MNDISPAVIERDEVALIPQPVFLPLASPNCSQVCAALAIAQGAMKTPRRTKTATVDGTTKNGSRYSYTYKYAPLEEIVDAVKEALAANGLARQQYLVSRGGQPVMRTIIWHASGEWIASDYPIHPTKEGAQGFASGVTYARRYGLSLALGLAPEDDDDANAAEGQLPLAASAASAARGSAASSTAHANGNGTPKPPGPLPKEPPPPEVHDPETGEIGPHLIPVLQASIGKADWIGWGGKLVTALQAAKTREEGEAWLRACKAALGNCERDAPKVHDRVQANIRVMRERLPDFMAAQ